MAHFFLQVESGGGESPWILLGPGFWIAFPTGFAVLGAAAGDDHTCFELHLLSATSQLEPGAFISFQPYDGPSESVTLTTPPEFERVEEGKIDSDGGLVRWAEFSYVHKNERWRRRYYTLPMGEDRALIMNAGSRELVAARLVAGADQIATLFFPAS
jgi:hypothetical protein